MPQPVSNQKPDSPRMPLAEPAGSVKTSVEGLWMKGADGGNENRQLLKSKPNLYGGSVGKDDANQALLGAGHQVEPETHTIRNSSVDDLNTRESKGAETVLSPPPKHRHGALTKKLSVAALFDATETGSCDIYTARDSEKAPTALSSSSHKLDLGNGLAHEAHTNASTNAGILIPEQSSSMQHFDTAKSPVRMLETSHDVFVGSSGFENMTEEDKLKWG
ncbi:hypothetical protein J3458_016894 [Metarhizium acridum]|uniref:Uncharacterized protein n=1 Tax=Metarhizium acridum (strain CQMa 102) TaxID=655827 RepID=E9EGW5_METAQ|nr:uncharacterized protein MAC_09113 [Metarhizium acridum CQMa 102]EFY84827.1 hypothetical protein MAC_09113 [Metarhizium acridum CQMa 102]KAG8410805.1 hypothetical protein J3458_016894 [Metarhizium acridum]